MLCVVKKDTVQSTPTSKPHLCCKVWWIGHRDLEDFCCLRAWTACYHQLKTEFPSLSGHLKENIRPTEAQQKLSDATGKQSKLQKWINNRMCSKEENMPSGVVQTSFELTEMLCGWWVIHQTSWEYCWTERIELKLKKFCQKDWCQFPPDNRGGLVHKYRTCLVCY